MDSEKLYNLDMTVLQFYCNISVILQKQLWKKIILHRPVEMGRELSTSDASLTDKLRGKQAPSFVFPVALCFLKSCKNQSIPLADLSLELAIFNIINIKQLFCSLKLLKR